MTSPINVDIMTQSTIFEDENRILKSLKEAEEEWQLHVADENHALTPLAELRLNQTRRVTFEERLSKHDAHQAELAKLQKSIEKRKVNREAFDKAVKDIGNVRKRPPIAPSSNVAAATHWQRILDRFTEPEEVLHHITQLKERIEGLEKELKEVKNNSSDWERKYSNAAGIMVSKMDEISQERRKLGSALTSKRELETEVFQLQTSLNDLLDDNQRLEGLVSKQTLEASEKRLKDSEAQAMANKLTGELAQCRQHLLAKMGETNEYKNRFERSESSTIGLLGRIEKEKTKIREFKRSIQGYIRREVGLLDYITIRQPLSEDLFKEAAMRSMASIEHDDLVKMSVPEEFEIKHVTSIDQSTEEVAFKQSLQQFRGGKKAMQTFFLRWIVQFSSLSLHSQSTLVRLIVLNTKLFDLIPQLLDRFSKSDDAQAYTLRIYTEHPFLHDVRKIECHARSTYLPLRLESMKNLMLQPEMFVEKLGGSWGKVLASTARQEAISDDHLSIFAAAANALVWKIKLFVNGVKTMVFVTSEDIAWACDTGYVVIPRGTRLKKVGDEVKYGGFLISPARELEGILDLSSI